MLFPLAVFLLNTTPRDVSWLNSYDSISYGLFDSMEDLRENVRVVHIDRDAQSTLAPSQMFFFGRVLRSIQTVALCACCCCRSPLLRVLPHSFAALLLPLHHHHRGEHMQFWQHPMTRLQVNTANLNGFPSCQRRSRSPPSNAVFSLSP